MSNDVSQGKQRKLGVWCVTMCFATLAKMCTWYLPWPNVARWSFIFCVMTVATDWTTYPHDSPIRNYLDILSWYDLSRIVFCQLLQQYDQYILENYRYPRFIVHQQWAIHYRFVQQTRRSWNLIVSLDGLAWALWILNKQVSRRPRVVDQCWLFFQLIGLLVLALSIIVYEHNSISFVTEQ